jgi:DNA-binding MurR/RpiR family transcriptional regulator
MPIPFEELITRNYPELTKSEKKVAEYVLKSPEEVAFLSSKALGKRVGVSDATVVRLSTALGISGYSELQERLRSWIKGRLTPSEKLRSTRVDRRKDIYTTIFEISTTNILNAQKEISRTKLNEAIDLLNHARKIFVVGLRRSHSFAFHLHYNLSRILDNVTLMDLAFGLIYDQVIEMQNRDVLVAISFARYSKLTLQIVKIAKTRKTSVVAITDSPLSPVSQWADVALCADHGSPFFFGSHASTLVIIDCLIGGLSLKHKKRSIRALERLEDTLETYGVWMK